MSRRLALAVLSMSAMGTQAAPPEFSPKLVIAAKRPGVFHNVDSTGRQHIAVSGQRIGVVWSDNREGTPQVFLTAKGISDARFPGTMKLSSGKPAFEPVIAALGSGKFLLAWEEGNSIHLRTLGPNGLGPTVALDERQAGQPSLATAGGQATLAYVRAASRFSQIMTRTLAIDASGKITPGVPVAIERNTPTDDQISPVVVANQGGVVVVWEDRREGHTLLLYSHSADRKSFSSPLPLNEQVTKSDRYGRGSGVTRAALTAWGPHELAAAWLDKRGSLTAYDVYAAVSSQKGKRFGKNEQAQDQFGNEIPQWHAAIAGDPQGNLVVAFDDTRDETADIQLSLRNPDGTWSDNFSPSVASGPGDQSHPAIALDANGRLHLVWLERESDGKPTQLLYSHAQLKP